MRLPELIQACADRYSTCRSYVDEGCVTTVWDRGQLLQRTQLQPFRTRFRRPDWFLFGYLARHGEHEWLRHVAWVQAGRCNEWWDVRRRDREPVENLSHALAGMTGVSSGAAINIPRLLMPDEVGHRKQTILSMLEDAEEVEGSMIDGVPCRAFRTRPQDRQSVVLIDPTCLAIRRIEEPGGTPSSLDSRQRQQIIKMMRERGLCGGPDPIESRTFKRPYCRTDYQPVFDIEVADIEFSFDPMDPDAMRFWPREIQ